MEWNMVLSPGKRYTGTNIFPTKCKHIFFKKWRKMIIDEINKNTTAIVVSYKCLDLIKESTTCFRKYYPEMKLIIVDGSSFDKSSKWVYDFARKDKNTRVLFNGYNIHHGPGMDAGIRISDTIMIFTFDTDTFLIKPNLIENMYEVVKNKNFYSIGTLHNVNNSGVDIIEPYQGEEISLVDDIEGRQKEIKYIHPRAKLIFKPNYLKFVPFTKHGAPCICSYAGINVSKHTSLLYHFPVHKYIYHPTGRGGTVSRTGGFHLG